MYSSVQLLMLEIGFDGSLRKETVDFRRTFRLCFNCDSRFAEREHCYIAGWREEEGGQQTSEKEPRGGTQGEGTGAYL
jgi:hypothetical protein